MYKGFLFLLIMKLACLIIFDFTLTNGDVFTNNYVGLGLSSILSETIVFGASLFLIAKNFGVLRFFNLKTFYFNPLKWRFNKAFFFNSGSVFIYSLINNAFYLFMMAKNMNIASGSSAYWVANGIIWNWVLMTSIIILSIQKSIVSTAGPITNKYRTFIIAEFQVIATIGFLISLAIFIPLYYPMMEAMRIGSPLKEESWTLFVILIGFFVFHVSGQSIIAQFVSEGKNWMVTIHSIVVNIIVYIPVIILNSTGDMDLTDSSVLAYMFGFTLLGGWVVAVVFGLLFKSKG